MSESANLSTPLTDLVIEGLTVGDHVSFTGVIYTARDAAHKRLIELADRGEADLLEVALLLGLPKREGEDPAAVHRPVVVAERRSGELYDPRLAEGVPELPPLGCPDVVGLVDEKVLAVLGHAGDDVGLALAGEGHRRDDDVAFLEHRRDRGGLRRTALQNAHNRVASVTGDDLEPRRFEQVKIMGPTDRMGQTWEIWDVKQGSKLTTVLAVWVCGFSPDPLRCDQ